MPVTGIRPLEARFYLPGCSKKGSASRMPTLQLCFGIFTLELATTLPEANIEPERSPFKTTIVQKEGPFSGSTLVWQSVPTNIQAMLHDRP